MNSKGFVQCTSIPLSPSPLCICAVLCSLCVFLYFLVFLSTVREIEREGASGAGIRRDATHDNWREENSSTRLAIDLPRRGK